MQHFAGMQSLQGFPAGFFFFFFFIDPVFIIDTAYPPSDVLNDDAVV